MAKNGKKSRNNGASQIGLSAEELMTYSLLQAGVPVARLAKDMGKAPSTLYRWRERIQSFVDNNLSIEDYRTPLMSLYPLIVISLVANLKKCDVQTTLTLAKGLGLLIEKSEHDFKGLGGNTSDELKQQLAELGLIPGAVTEGDEDNPRASIPS